MPAISPPNVVAVTGASGFVGGWAVRLLLERGYRVRACVRDPDDEKSAFLKAMDGFASGRLTLHAASLEDAGSFDAPFAPCGGVLHISHTSDYQDENYVKQVCDNVISSINAATGIKRVVVTSSIAAILTEGDITELTRRPTIDEDRYPDEDSPKRTYARQGYAIAKLHAQRAFADAAAAHGGWDAITCCPADNIGPIQARHQKNRGPWQHIIEGMLEGKYYQTEAYRPWMTVDVRDDAAAHIGLLESERIANGERYIAWSTDARNVEDVCASIDRLLPELHHDAPEVTDPFPERIQAREAELREIWAGLTLKNDRIRAVTDVNFRPLDDSIRDCVESLINVGGVTVQRREGAP